LQQCDLISVEAELLADDLRGAFRQRMLAKQGSGDEGLGQAGTVNDLRKGQVLASLGQNDHFSQFLASGAGGLSLDHGESPG